MEKLKELSKQPDIYERLTKSMAPNIWELDDVKKGLLCQVAFFMRMSLCLICSSMLLEPFFSSHIVQIASNSFLGGTH